MRSPASSLGSSNRDTRRRIIKAGVAAVPVIMTLHARPIRADDEAGSLGLYVYDDTPVRGDHGRRRRRGWERHGRER